MKQEKEGLGGLLKRSRESSARTHCLGHRWAHPEISFLICAASVFPNVVRRRARRLRRLGPDDILLGYPMTPAAKRTPSAYTAAHLLLVGNSINRLSAAQSWDELLQSLTRRADPEANRRRGDKPFTLFFEELRNRYVYRQKGQPEDFMWEIGKTFSCLPSSDLHHRIMDLPFSNILTTNYDYALEKAVEPKADYTHPSDDFRARETKFSLFRRRTCGGKAVWHIHGEASVPTSIMLGHDHYTDYAAQVRRYFYQGALYRGTGSFRSGLQRDVGTFDQNCDGRPYSWVDLFVRDHVHIGGFSFDFSESLLWYLVSYRRRRREHMLRAGYPLCSSDVTFYYFTDRETEPRHLAIVEVLESFDVRCVPIDRSTGGYAAGWETLLNRWQSLFPAASLATEVVNS